MIIVTIIIALFWYFTTLTSAIHPSLAHSTTSQGTSHCEFVFSLSNTACFLVVPAISHFAYYVNSRETRLARRALARVWEKAESERDVSFPPLYLSVQHISRDPKPLILAILGGKDNICLDTSQLSVFLHILEIYKTICLFFVLWVNKGMCRFLAQ